ncbi:TetR/AcrR family transcriptional regulator [Luteipulveratus mongoliensis]|uniref:HTH tetR-type domain-containing protein n=1 Tax=Luteipulveratus mongoliensis TaxID=571913 RepID=A0A0K1JI59_9MICO|nr:TetR/AcrR family transcriptional regulator [Luteipulveratus mongoliensis]AKU16391.1 hypothetical protein VV02_11830 [Luteipulveratus mongoliensis]
MVDDRLPGRPRSEASRAATLRAAYDLLQEKGFRQVTTAEIARRAGVSTATVYRWWDSKADVLLDAVHEQGDRYPAFEEGDDTFTELLTEVRGVIRFYASATGQATLDLVAESRFDDDLARGLRERFIAGRRASAKAVLRRGIERGEVRSDLRLDAAVDAIWGALYYRLQVSGEPLRPAYARELLTTLWPALSAQAG